VKLVDLHPWELTAAEAERLQRRLAPRVEREGWPQKVNLIAGVDVSAPDKKGGPARGAVVLLSYPSLEPLLIKTREGALNFPYIPGLLAFRELPLLLDIFAEIEAAPDLVLVDGQGIAHPRRLGIASHLGLFLDVPTIGCAKSILRGRHGPLAPERGSRSWLLDGEEVIGAALRTQTNAPPVYVSIGHRISLDACLHWVLETCRAHRLPEPIRLAHLAAGNKLKPGPPGRQGTLF